LGICSLWSGSVEMSNWWVSKSGWMSYPWADIWLPEERNAPFDRNHL
jgi:hypothetical protein